MIPPHLKIISWNIYNYNRSRSEIEILLANENPDILLLQETHLHPNFKFNITGYTIHRSDFPVGKEVLL